MVCSGFDEFKFDSMNVSKPLRVLIGILDGPEYSRQLAEIAKLMPESAVRYIGFLWASGSYLRKNSFDYVNAGIWSNIKNVSDITPAIREYGNPDKSWHNVPKSAKVAFSTLGELVVSEIKSFKPDVIVHQDIDNAVSYLLSEYGREYGIPTIGLQNSFISKHYMVWPYGARSIQYFQNAKIFENVDDDISMLNQNVLSYRIASAERKNGSSEYWMRQAERFFRLLIGGISFDTYRGAYSLLCKKISKVNWFPKLEIIDPRNKIGMHVLIVLHQPLLDANEPTWLDLINFALDAVPLNIPIIIRPHPKEKSRRIPDALENSLILRGVRISKPDKDPNIQTLLKSCKAVITLSSSVGMEALLQGVYVFTLGPAYYARAGMAESVTILESGKVRHILEKDAELRPDMKIVKAFYMWLLEYYLIPVPLQHPDGAGRLVDWIRMRANLADSGESTAYLHHITASQ